MQTWHNRWKLHTGTFVITTSPIQVVTDPVTTTCKPIGSHHDAKIINRNPTSSPKCCYTTLWNVNVRNRCIPSGNWKVQLHEFIFWMKFFCDAIRTAMLISSASRMKRCSRWPHPKNAQNDRLYAPAAMKKRRHCRTPSAHSSDVLTVVDGFGRRVKAGMHSLNIRWPWPEN